jgi:hypothetical protein
MEKMIQPNELRIGNVLMYSTTDGDFRNAVDVQDLTSCEDDNVWFNEVHQRIPLTPDLLLELAENNYSMYSFQHEYGIKGVWISWDLHKQIAFANTPYIEIPYLHTLQNFIFAVKGEELTINTK